MVHISASGKRLVEVLVFIGILLEIISFVLQMLHHCLVCQAVFQEMEITVSFILLNFLWECH